MIFKYEECEGGSGAELLFNDIAECKTIDKKEKI